MDYYSILRRSWEIVKKHKVLWVFGLVLASFSGSTGSGGGNSSSSTKDLQKIFEQKDQIPPQTGEKISQILGAMTSDPKAFFLSLIQSIPPAFWVAFVVGVVAAVLFYLVLGIFMRNWAKGALFTLAAEADANNEVSLRKGSLQGLRAWKRLFISHLILGGGFVVSFLIIGVVIAIIFGISSIAKFLVLVPALLTIFAIFAFFIALVVVMVWSVYTDLSISLEDMPWKRALKYSWHLTKKYFWQTLMMGGINIGIGCLSSIIVLVVLGLFIGAVVVTGLTGFALRNVIGDPTTLLVGLPLVGILLVALLAVLGLFGGILQAFTSTNWVLFYGELKKQSEFPREGDKGDKSD